MEETKVAEQETRFDCAYDQYMTLKHLVVEVKGKTFYVRRLRDFPIVVAHRIVEAVNDTFRDGKRHYSWEKRVKDAIESAGYTVKNWVR